MTTIILPVSRPNYLRAIFARLELLDCDRADTNILVIVDGDVQLFQTARDLTVESKFFEKLCVYRHKGNANVGSVRLRRQRIADIHNELKANLGKADYLFLIEDDTLFPTNALRRLLEKASSSRNVGIVSGIELGRWGYLHIGAWVLDDVYDVTCMKTILLETGTQKVDATGLYCCVVRAEHYLKHTFAPFNEAIGPDVGFGVALRREGLQNYVDFDIKCTHLTVRDSIIVDQSKIVQVALEKIGNTWIQREVEQ